MNAPRTHTPLEGAVVDLNVVSLRSDGPRRAVDDQAEVDAEVDAGGRAQRERLYILGSPGGEYYVLSVGPAASGRWPNNCDFTAWREPFVKSVLAALYERARGDVEGAKAALEAALREISESPAPGGARFYADTPVGDPLCWECGVCRVDEDGCCASCGATAGSEQRARELLGLATSPATGGDSPDTVPSPRPRWRCSGCGYETSDHVGRCNGYCYDASGSSCDAVPCPNCGRLHYWSGAPTRPLTESAAPDDDDGPLLCEMCGADVSDDSKRARIGNFCRDGCTESPAPGGGQVESSGEGGGGAAGREASVGPVTPRHTSPADATIPARPLGAEGPTDYTQGATAAYWRGEAERIGLADARLEERIASDATVTDLRERLRRAEEERDEARRGWCRQVVEVSGDYHYGNEVARAWWGRGEAERLFPGGNEGEDASDEPPIRHGLVAPVNERLDRHEDVVGPDRDHQVDVTLASVTITIDPGICGGAPCVAGTRIPVAALLAFMLDGLSVDQLRRFYPEVSQGGATVLFAVARRIDASFEVTRRIDALNDDGTGRVRDPEAEERSASISKLSAGALRALLAVFFEEEGCLESGYEEACCAGLVDDFRLTAAGDETIVALQRMATELSEVQYSALFLVDVAPEPLPRRTRSREPIYALRDLGLVSIDDDVDTFSIEPSGTAVVTLLKRSQRLG